MIERRLWIVGAAFVLLALAACSQKPPAATTTAPVKSVVIPKGKLPVTLAITGVAISSAASPILRVSFNINNGGKSMLLCDPSFFYIQLIDGTTIPADEAADNACDPDSLDPKASGTSRMYFDLTAPYTGKLALIMEANNGKVVGATTTIIK